MRSIWAGVGIGFVIVLTIGGGLIQGRLTNRWGQPVDLVAAGKQLEQIPNQIGTWETQSSSTMDASAKEMLECAGEIYRNYVNSATGAVISVMVIVGPAGPISEHIPEVCYSTQNFQLLGKRQVVEIRDTSGQPHALWQVDFNSREIEPRLVRTFYAWSTGGPWLAPTGPRFEFSGRPLLYKIQLAETLPPQATQQTTSAIPSFLNEFLPAVAATLSKSQ